MLLDGRRVIGAALDRRVVGYDDDFAPRHAGNSSHEASARRLVVVHIPGGERRQLEQGRARIDQAFDSFPDRDLSLFPVTLKGAGSAALPCGRHPVPQLRHQPRHARVIVGELRIGRSNVGVEAVHRRV
jgi:hypothetical protein